LPEIDNISSLEFTTLETPRPLEPSELLAPGLSRLSNPENKPSEPVLRPSEKPIKPVDSLDPDEI